jgi:hypothetical protein
MPDSIAVEPGGSCSFTALGFDSAGAPVKPHVRWSTTGGRIESSGLFSAGADTGYFHVFAMDTLSGLYDRAVVHIRVKTGIGETAHIVPDRFYLTQNYPNPFNPVTTIEYGVKEKTMIHLTIYNIMGRTVMELIRAEQAPGCYRITFDAGRLASGIYFYKIQMGTLIQVRKMMLLR